MSSHGVTKAGLTHLTMLGKTETDSAKDAYLKIAPVKFENSYGLEHKDPD